MLTADQIFLILFGQCIDSHTTSDLDVVVRQLKARVG